MRTKLITLAENLVYKPGLLAEHGYSVYIEHGDSKILFDTGQRGTFLHNMKNLNIAPESINTAIISHGHYDHTGGLIPFLNVNKTARILAKDGILDLKFNKNDRFIGTEKDEDLFRNRLTYIDKVTEIAKDIFIIPQINIYNQADTHFHGLMVKQNDTLVPDTFFDELFIVIKQDDAVNILTACSHRGITNIVRTACEIFNLPPGKIIGGFHLKDCTPQQLDLICSFFKDYPPRAIGVSHCTGVDQYAYLKANCDFPVFYNCTGYELYLGEN